MYYLPVLRLHHPLLLSFDLLPLPELLCAVQHGRASTVDTGRQCHVFRAQVPQISRPPFSVLGIA